MKKAIVLIFLFATANVFGIDVCDIFAMPRDEALRREQCTVTGVVTHVAGWRGGSGVLASPNDPDGRAIYFYTQQAPDASGAMTNLVEASFREGDVMEVRGCVDPLGFRPGIGAFAFRSVGRLDMGCPP